MKISRLWPFPVLIFCLYCLYTLVADSYEVLYRKANETEPLQFLACVDLSRVCPTKTEIDLKELGSQLYDHLNSSIDNYARRNYQKSFEKVILNRTKFGGYLVLNRRVCLIAMDQNELKDICGILAFETVLFAMKNDTFDFFLIKHLWDQIEQKIILKKGPPYSDCDENNGRFLCLNECFRSRFRLARYFYHANETGRILLNYSESNRTIRENEKTCFRQCKRENCKLVKQILVDLHKKLKPPENFEAQPVLSAFDFWLQITGLIISFVGLFFDRFASTATKLTEKLTRSAVRRKKVKAGLFYLNLAIIILSLAYWGYLCVQVALDQQAEANDLLEREITRNLIYPKTVHLAICVGIKRNDYKGKMMWEIERATDKALDDALEGIHVSDGGRSFQTNYRVHHKVLFKKLVYNFGRCFPLSIQPNYQTIPSRPKLTVRLKKFNLNFELYVLSEEENLNRKSFRYYGWYAFQKRIVKRLESRGCVDYKAKYVDGAGRQNCVDRCIARKFIERYNITTFGYYYGQVIDRDWFSPLEWNTSQLMDPYQDKSLYLKTSGECEQEVPEKACDETTFEETVRISPSDPLTMEIDLQFDVVQSAEELPSWLRMALDLLGIQSIFFGFTLLQLFWMVYQFTKPRWRWRMKDKTDKVVWFIVCLLASIGCSWTTVRMLDVIVNGELVPIEHYESAERIQMPAMVFCLRIDQKLIDWNHQLTGSYLEKLTANITSESTFKNITYLNESNDWTPFDLRRVERFFLLDMKCFRVNIDQSYDRNQFHFPDNTQVLRVNFKKMKGDGVVHFMTQSNETAEFSKILNLKYSWSKWGSEHGYQITHEASLYEHEDRFSYFRRHFPPLPEGNVDYLHRQLLELQGNELNRRTLKLPLEEEHFSLEVNEDHFEQLYSAQQKKKPSKRTNLNYRQMFVANHLRKNLNYLNKFDLTFQLVFLRRVMHFTNEVNLATLTLSLLNLLSLWLELGVLDLSPFLVRLYEHLLVPICLHLPVLLLRKLTKVLLFFWRWLKKLKLLFERRTPKT